MRSYLQSRFVVLGLLLTPALTLWSVAGQAQTVTLDGVAPIALSTSTTVSAVSIDPATGNVIVKSSVGTYTSCTFIPAAVPTITSFSPSSSVVTPGGNITLNWTSTNTTSCNGTQGGSTIWSSLGTLPTSGSQNLTAPNSGTVTFQLNCTNGTQTVSSTTQVTVQTQGGSCAKIYPNGTSTTWNGSFNVWPAFGVRPRFSIPWNGYLAFSFTATSSTTQFGTVATSDYPGDGDGNGQMSISRSPDEGCFVQAQLGAHCLSPVARLPSVGWANFPNQFSCALTPGQAYYVNITYGNQTSPGSVPNCPIGPNQNCGADIQNQIQD
jgi:hypothetical protein